MTHYLNLLGWLGAIWSLIMLVWGDTISGAIGGGLRAGRAQAGQEYRRKLDHGADRGPRSPWWWAGKADKGARKVARAATRPAAADGLTLPSHRAGRRIGDAIRTGAAEGATAARARRATARAARTTSTSRRRAEGSGPAAAAPGAGAPAAGAAGAPRPEGTAPVGDGYDEQRNAHWFWWWLPRNWRRDDDQDQAEQAPAGPAPDTTTVPYVHAEPVRPPAIDNIVDAEVLPDPQPADQTPAAIPAARQNIPAIASTGTRELMAGTVARRYAGGGHTNGAEVTARQAASVAGSNGGMTHGAYQRINDAVSQALGQARVCGEGMHADLADPAADAGKTHLSDVAAWTADYDMIMRQVDEAQRVIGAKLNPVVDATTAIGGPSESASAAYLQDV